MNQMNEESLFFVFAESRSRPAKRCDSDREAPPKHGKLESNATASLYITSISAPLTLTNHTILIRSMSLWLSVVRMI